jgi:subtilase family serine protease
MLDPATDIAGMKLMLKRTDGQTADLEQLLEDQRDPLSPSYRQWLTPEQFGERFGASPGDIATLTEWLGSQGFTVSHVARARNWIVFEGSAATVESAFHTELHRYLDGTERHFANAGDPSVPSGIAEVVGSIHGLDDFRPKPFHTTARPTRFAPDYTSGGAHYLAPDDLATIYDISTLYSAGIDGTGQKLVIVGQTDIYMSDIQNFRSQFGLTANNPTLVLTGPDPGFSPGDAIESDLDLEWSGAVARKATILFVYSQNVFTSVEYAIDEDLAPVISMSYGGCEIGAGTGAEAIAQQGNAEGITWMNSSGDSGAAGCDYDVTAATHGLAVTSPADVPEITAVGGTELNEGSSGWSATNGSTLASVTGYLPEEAWDDIVAGYDIESGGGGASVVFSKPWWQTGPGVPNDGARDVPDVSLTASADHDGYLIYDATYGGWLPIGGTSASSPSFAGIVALINQYVAIMSPQSKTGQGNINPSLYSLAQNSSGVFHDVTGGSNVVPCKSGTTGCTTGSYGYKAGPGFDLATGLGSVDAYNLVMNWPGVSTLTKTSTTLAATPTTITQSASAKLTATVTAASGKAAPSGTVAFAVGNVSLGSAAVAATTATSASSSVTVAGSSLTVGSNTLSATFTAAGVFSSSTTSTTVTVTAVPVSTTTTLAASPASVPANESTQLTATVKAGSGSAAPTGTVTFSLGSTQLGSATLAASGANATSSAATLALSGAKLVKGANSITAGYAGATGFNASLSSPLTVTATAALVATTTMATASPATIPMASSTVLTVTVKPASGTTAPTGTVSFTAGNTSLGSAPLRASGTSSSATLPLQGSVLTAGANLINATYSGDTVYLTSSGTVTVTVTVVVVATKTTLTANPSSIAPNAATLLSATVTPTTGTGTPSGTVTFTKGTASLGSAPLVVSGGLATATLQVTGTSLTSGANGLTATYGGATQFSGSSGSVTVTVGGAVATTLSATAAPPSIAASGSTQISVTVKVLSGSGPTGAVSFAVGKTSLGSAPLTTSGLSATASLTVNGNSLAVGVNTITVTYAANAAFGASSGSVAVNVTAASATSNVAATAVKTTSNQPGFAVLLTLQETAGVATTVKGFTICGTDFSSVIAGAFGSAQLPAHGTLSATLIIQWSPLPSPLVFAYSGADAGGHTWTQSVSLSTK